MELYRFYQDIPTLTADQFEDRLATLALANLDPDDAWLLLAQIIEVLRVNYLDDFLVPLLAAFGNFYPFDVSRLLLDAALFTRPELDITALQWIRDVLDLNWRGVVSNLVQYQGDDVDTLEAVARAWETFQPVTRQDLADVCNGADLGGGNEALKYLAARYREVSFDAPLPPWVRDFGLVEPATPSFYQSSPLPLPSTDELVEVLLRSVEAESGATIDLIAAKGALGSDLRRMADWEKALLVKESLAAEHLAAVQSSLIQFRLYGPLNLPRSTSESHPPIIPSLTLLESGDYLMLRSTLYDYDEEYGAVIDSFTGSCDWCEAHIRRRHALRQPQLGGGFDGWYCSERCARAAHGELLCKMDYRDTCEVGDCTECAVGNCNHCQVKCERSRWLEEEDLLTEVILKLVEYGIQIDERPEESSDGEPT